MNHKSQYEATPPSPRGTAASAPEDGGPDRRAQPGSFRTKLPFFRMILWILVYAGSALFLMSLILLRFRIQTLVIGVALLVCIGLVVATYAL